MTVITFTPSETDSGGTAIAIATLALGAIATGTLDLRNKPGGWIQCSVGRGGTTALTAGIAVAIRRRANGGAISVPTVPNFVGDVAAASSRPTCASSGNTAAGANLVTVTTGFAAGDLVFIDDTGNVGLSASEWVRVSKVTSTVTHQLDQNGGLQNSHNSTSAHATNHADIWPWVWCEGGAIWEVVFDYGASTTGDTNVVRAIYQTMDSWVGN